MRSNRDILRWRQITGVGAFTQNRPLRKKCEGKSFSNKFRSVEQSRDNAFKQHRTY